MRIVRKWDHRLSDQTFTKMLTFDELPYNKILEALPRQWEAICLSAVHCDPGNLYCVRKQTAEMCLLAVQKNGCTVEAVKKQTPEICLAAARQDKYALRLVRDPVLRQKLQKRLGWKRVPLP